MCDPTTDGKIGDPASLVWVSGHWTGNQGSWTQRCRDKPFPAREAAAVGALSGRQVILLKLRLRGRPLRAGGSGARCFTKGQHPVDLLTHIVGYLEPVFLVKRPRHF